MIPIQFSPSELTIFVIMSQINLDRIKDYDPAVIKWGKLPDELRFVPVKEIHLCYATKEETAAIEAVAKKQDTNALLAEILKLGRNFRYRPELVDNDDPKYKLAGSSKPTEE